MNSPPSGERLEFECPECNGKVVYERKTVIGAFRRRKAEPASTHRVSVYLSCEKGHIHRYEVPASGRKD